MKNSINVVLSSRLTYDTNVVCGKIEVNGQEFNNTVTVPARGRATIDIDPDVAIQLPKGITITRGSQS